MGENIVVNVEFEGTNLGTGNEIQVVPCDIQWEDLELMLKVYAGHEEDEELIVKYQDEDNDKVMINTQEELQEAFKVAKRSNNTLRLFVICDEGINRTPQGTQEGNMVVTANIMTQSVSMATTSDTVTEDTVVSSTNTVIMHTPDVVPTAPPPEEDIVMPEVVTMETGEEKSAEEDEDCMIVDAKEAAEAKSDKPIPAARRKRLFYIKNKHTGLVLDINGGNTSPGIAVIVWPRKPGRGQDNKNQLWYWDERSTTIRSALNDLCMDVSGRKTSMARHQPGSHSQLWKLTNGQIQHCLNPKLVVVCPSDQPGMTVFATEAGASLGTKDWDMVYLDSPRKKVCTNKETGEQCSGASKATRPKAHKRGKKDVYAELAKEIGKDLPKTASFAGASPKKRAVGGATSAAVATATEDVPPTWFFGYMDKFKREITEDMAKLISRRTVHQVLKGLNNAIIDTVKVTDTGIVREQRSTPEDKNQPHYCHEGVMCDNCEKIIVGVRYKCGNCDDYDLCEACEVIPGVHDPEHVFLKIRQPVVSSGRKKNGRMAPLLKVNLYSQDNSANDKAMKKEEKLLQKYEKLEEKIRRKEEKLKRRLEASKETPQKKEKLDLPQYKVVGQIDLDFVTDENIPDGTHVQPGTRIQKKWLVRNCGIQAWDSSFQLTMMWGNMTPVSPDVAVPHLQPEEEGVILAELIAPAEPGTYQSHWRLSCQGRRYGNRIWCTIVVDPKETLEPINEDVSMLNVATEEAVTTPLITTDDATTCTGADGREGEEWVADDLYKIMSHKTLSLEDRPRAKASQTATPNNTPRDVTPPKSPIVELRGLSTSSSVEVVAVGDVEADGMDEETMSRMTELVQERMASLGLKPDELTDADLEGWSSYEEDLSDDTDSDFYVVPIPDCFNPELPPTSSASTSIYIKKEEAKSIDEMLTTSRSLESQPLLTPNTTETAPEVFTSPEAISSPHTEESCDAPSVSSPPRVEATILPEPLDTDVRDLSTYEPLEGDNDVIVVRVEMPSDSPPEVQTVPKEVESGVGTEEEEEEEGEDGAVGGQMDDTEVTDQNANLPLDINDNSAGTPNQEYETPLPVLPAGEARDTDPREMSPVAGELAANVVSAARGFTSYATQAAHVAYSTAKDVFQTLQAKDKYTPTQSNWEPTDENWSPPERTWTPPTQDVPAKQTAPMDQLIEMGFANRRLNQMLLDKYNFDLDKVISHLVEHEDNEWHSGRH